MRFFWFLLFAPSILLQCTAKIPDVLAEEPPHAQESSSRIVNGHDAPVGRFPYIVSLQKPDGSHLCGGTLIAPDIVLSAGHCFKNEEDFLVRTNTHDRSDPLEGSEVFGVVDSTIHPSYTEFLIPNNDIWVIQLDGRSSHPFIRLSSASTIQDKNQPLSVAGWGILEWASPDPAPFVLQLHDELTYISNEVCEATLKQYNSRTTITDDIMCTQSPPAGGGSCQGDSGGPTFIKGKTMEDDIQVGIVSFAMDCGLAVAPTGNSRVSWGFEFIRSQVCILSNFPPAYFKCDEPFETLAPTASPPFANRTDVRLNIKFDDSPQDTFVLLQDENANAIFLYNGKDEPIRSTYFSIAKLDIGKEYTLTITDGFGDGLCCGDDGAGNIFVFLGNETDYHKVLAYVDGHFLTSVTTTFTISEDAIISFDSPTALPSESISPSMSPTLIQQKQNVTVLINFDTFSSVNVSWRIFELNNSNRIVHAVERGSYTPLDGDVIAEVVSLELGAEYVFEMHDTGGDGICCEQGEGYVEIYFGTEIASDQLLIFERGDFTNFTSHIFAVRPDSTVTVTTSPSAPPSVSVVPTTSIAPSFAMIDIVIQIQFDSVPWDTYWELTDAAGEILMSEHVGHYAFHVILSGSSVVMETVSVPLGQEYTFTLYDYSADGLCCNRGQGYAAVFLKEAVQNQTLLYLDGNFEFATLGTFIASEEAVLDSPIPDFTNNPTDVRTRSPTLAPSVSWLPSADAPMTSLESTVDATTITMVISLDANPAETGVRLFRRGSGQFLRGINPGSFNAASYAGKTFSQQIVVSNAAGTDLVLEVTDSAGDGMAPGSVVIYLGNKADGNILAYDDGNFEERSVHQFFASTAGIISTSIPLLTVAPVAAVPVALFPIAVAATKSPTMALPIDVISSTPAGNTVAPVTPAPIAVSATAIPTAPIVMSNAPNMNTPTTTRKPSPASSAAIKIERLTTMTLVVFISAVLGLASTIA